MSQKMKPVPQHFDKQFHRPKQQIQLFFYNKPWEIC